MIKDVQNIVIVGGGFVGTLAALNLSRFDHINLTLIEKDNHLGGLYRTAWSFDTYHFDYGARAILETGVPDFDDLLFRLLPDKYYIKSTDSLKEFSYQAGKLREYTNCVDARLLPDDLYRRARNEALAIDADDIRGCIFTNVSDYTRAHFGETILDHLVRPLVQKLTGLDADSVHPNLLFVRGLSRVIIADQSESIALKSESSFNDLRFAFARYDDHESKMVKCRPLSDGMDDFGARMLDHLNNCTHTEVILGDVIAGFERSGRQIEALKLASGRRIESDRVIWSIAPIGLAKLLGTDLAGISPPRFRDIILVHVLFDGEVKTSSHFLYDYEPNHELFRTTFYDNYNSRTGPLRSVTMEAFAEPDQQLNETVSEDLFDELRRTKAISRDSRLVQFKLQRLPRSAPCFTTDYFDTNERLGSRVSSEAENLDLLPRGMATENGEFTKPLSDLMIQI